MEGRRNGSILFRRLPIDLMGVGSGGTKSATVGAEDIDIDAGIFGFEDDDDADGSSPISSVPFLKTSILQKIERGELT